jgi:hypothetical protein
LNTLMPLGIATIKLSIEKTIPANGDWPLTNM